jgi:hypothetical protein
MHNRCVVCQNVMNCPVCGEKVDTFNHVGVRGVKGKTESGVWHWAKPCGHRITQFEVKKEQGGGALATYGGGPLWQSGYTWVNIFWGSYWSLGNPGLTFALQIEHFVIDIERDKSYSGGLSEYNVGQSTDDINFQSTFITDDPPSTIDDSAIQTTLQQWIQAGKVKDVKGKGAYNIFLPPGVTVTLEGSQSCVEFCDYHNNVSDVGPFYTVIPYPCVVGCNECTQNTIDTLTMGLSEEMTELKTDMVPGTGWVIGNLELCDYCDASYVCNQLSTGEYVNAWYSNAQGKCWGKATAPPPPQTQCLGDFLQLIADLEAGNTNATINDFVQLLDCLATVGLDTRKVLEALVRKEIDRLKKAI